MTAIVFDLDGTLIDSLGNIAAAANALLDGAGLPPLPDARIAGFVGHGEQVFLDRLIGATDLRPERRAELMAAFLEHYRQASRDTVLFDGARAALDRLAAAGHGLGLCTNKPGGPLRTVLEVTDLGRTFGAVVAGDTLPRRKPDPAPLRHAFDLLGAAGGVFVGDSEIDAETARRAGVPFALFARGIRTTPLSEIPHDALFHDFAELDAIVERLARPLTAPPLG